MDTPTRPRLAGLAPALVTAAKHPRNAKLELPASVSRRWIVVQLANTNRTYAYAAALGLSWRGAGAPAVRWLPADPAAYGELVMDDLLARDGVSLGDVIEAGGDAFARLAASLVTDEEVEEARGNSEAPAVDSNG